MAFFSLSYLRTGFDDYEDLTEFDKKFIEYFDEYVYHDSEKYNTLNFVIMSIYDNISIEYVYIHKKGKSKIYYNQDNICTEADLYTDNNGNECCKPLNPKKTNKFIHYKIKIDKTMKDHLMFPKNYKVTLINKSGINYDHRGSNHTKIELDFHTSWELKDNRYKTFVHGLYRIKSHKFDRCYELFLYITNVEVDRENKTIKIVLKFDHGS